MEIGLTNMQCVCFVRNVCAVYCGLGVRCIELGFLLIDRLYNNMERGVGKI